MRFSFFLTVILSICSFVSAKAQETPATADSFYILKKQEYQAWLKRSGLSDYISCDSLVSEGRYVRLYLKAPAWDSLEVKFKEKFGLSLPVYLSDKMVLTFDVIHDDSWISVDAGKNTLFIEHKDNVLQIRKFKKQGQVSGSVQVNITNIRLANTSTAYSEDNYEKTIAKLKSGLQEHYRQKAPLIEKLVFDIYTKTDKRLYFEVSNAVNEVLQDGYFEKIVIIFTLSEENKKLLINYTIDGKYASGILWAPKDKGWKDIDGEYQERMNKYSMKMADKINEILKN